MGQEKKISDWMINFTAKKSFAKVTSGGSVGDRRVLSILANEIR